MRNRVSQSIGRGYNDKRRRKLSTFFDSNFLFIYHIRNVVCGSLQCKDGDRQPNMDGYQLSSKTIISIKGVEYECK